MTIADGSRKYVYGVGLAYVVTGSSIEVVHPDRLGSVRSITNGAGTVTATFKYDEWGSVVASTGSSAEPFGFAGEMRDATGLTYLRAPYEDPSLGRFKTRDPIAGNPRSCQTLNRYTYVANNPMTMTDPSGHKAKALAASDEKISACPAAAWGAAVLVGEGGGVALAASEGGLLVAGAGAVALTGGLILVGIGIVGIAGGFYLFYMGCIE